MNKKGIRYVLSFDGIRGDKEYETGIPKELYVKKFFLASGNSSFKKVMDKSNEQVYEALYLNWYPVVGEGSLMGRLLRKEAYQNE